MSHLYDTATQLHAERLAAAERHRLVRSLRGSGRRSLLGRLRIDRRSSGRRTRRPGPAPRPAAA
ncbi:MAG: hypothetical protein AAGA93_23175 [Actinomycetota bacterium]